MNSGRILHHLNTRLRHCPPGRTRWALVCTTPRATYSLSDTVTPAVYNLSAYERPFGDNTRAGCGDGCRVTKPSVAEVDLSAGARPRRARWRHGQRSTVARSLPVRCPATRNMKWFRAGRRGDVGAIYCRRPPPTTLLLSAPALLRHSKYHQPCPRRNAILSPYFQLIYKRTYMPYIYVMSLSWHDYPISSCFPYVATLWRTAGSYLL